MLHAGRNIVQLYYNAPAPASFLPKSSSSLLNPILHCMAWKNFIHLFSYKSVHMRAFKVIKGSSVFNNMCSKLRVCDSLNKKIKFLSEYKV